MNIEKHLRTMAKNSYWQRVYKSSKKMGSICLFENTKNISGIQAYFLYWLEVYDSLYNDLGSKEYDILDEEVIEDDIRCDAFLYWKKRHIEQENSKSKRDIKRTNRKGKPSNVKSFNIFDGVKK